MLVGKVGPASRIRANLHDPEHRNLGPSQGRRSNATYANPMRYLMVILRGTFLEGDGVAALLEQYWPLALLGAASITAATFLAWRRMA